MMNSSGFEIFMSGVLLISSIVWNECVSMKIVQQARQARGGRVNVYNYTCPYMSMKTLEEGR